MHKFFSVIIVFSCFVILAIWLVLTPVAFAVGVVFTVNSTGDSNDVTPGNGKCETVTGNQICTLRAAVSEANALAGADMINVPAGTFLLSQSGGLVITQDLTIHGAGANQTIVDGNGNVTNNRVFRIAEGVTVSINNLTVQNGFALWEEGGNILNRGALTLTDVVIRSGGSTYDPGGLMNFGSAQLVRVTVAENKRSGIVNRGEMTILNSWIHDNLNGVYVAGISNEGALTIRDSRLSSNGQQYALAGAILNWGTLLLESSTLDNNYAGAGAALVNQAGNTVVGYAELRNVTISNNMTEQGGAVFADYSSATFLTNVTFAENRGNWGGALATRGGSLTLRNTILQAGSSGVNCYSAVATNGGNLSSDNSCAPWLMYPTDHNNTSAQLGPLQNNGGVTFTHAIVPGSAAIDAGVNSWCPLTDQRGAGRPFDGDNNGSAVCDIGAIEYNPGPTPTVTATPSLTPTVTPGPSRTPTATLANVTISVNTTQDDLIDNGNCTLREAIQAANIKRQVDQCPAGGASTQINLSSGIYVLTTGGPREDGNVRGDLDVRANIHFHGVGMNETIIDGNGAALQDRVLDLGTNFNIRFANLTIQHGDNVLTEWQGGGIWNRGSTLMLDAVRLSENFSGRGAALYNAGALTVRDSEFLNNEALVGDSSGGGIYNDGPLTVERSLFADNVAFDPYSRNSGGAIYDAYGDIPFQVSITDSVFRHNYADDSGGAVSHNREQSTLTLKNVLFENNYADIAGGLGVRLNSTALVTNVTFIKNRAYYNSGAINNQGTLKLVNVTLSGNEIQSQVGLPINGGGAITAFSYGSVEMINSTVWGNIAPGPDGGSASIWTNVPFTIKNSIIANTTTGINCSGAITSLGHNLSTDDTCGLNTGSDLSNTDPQVLALAQAGGVLLHQLVVGSPAIDAGDNTGCPAQDARGVARPQDGNGDHNAVCDIGAFEYDAAAPPPTPTVTPTPTATATPRPLNIFYVSPTGNDANSCASPANACASIAAPFTKNGFIAGDIVKIAQGTFTGTDAQVVLLDKNVTLSGGWDVTFTDQTAHTTIDGQNARRGILIQPGLTVTLERLIVMNGAADDGAGVYASNGTLTVNASIFTKNTAVHSGGGLTVDAGTLYVNDTTISENTAGVSGSGGGGGAGIYNLNGTLVVNRSTLSNNKIISGFYGNAINGTTWLTIQNSTISGNTGPTDSPALALFGVRKFILKNSTLVNNGSYGIFYQGGNVQIANTLIAGHTLGDCRIASGASGSITSLGHNLFQTNANCPLDTTDLISVNPRLGALQDNGGMTGTHALKANSPAVDGGDNIICLDTDQRGRARPYDGNGDSNAVCDIGAFEADTVLVVETPTPSATPTWTVTPSVTPAACSSKPSNPVLVAPSDGSTRTKARVKLQWQNSDCVTQYKIRIYKAYPTKQLHKKVNGWLTTQYTIILPKGNTYLWRVIACNAIGCTRSGMWSFKLSK